MADRVVVLVEGDVEKLQAQFPEFEFMHASVEPAKLKGRDVRMLSASNSTRKFTAPKPLRAVIEEYAASRHFVSVTDVIDDVLGIGKWPFRHSYELQVAKVLRDMGWKKACLRNGPYRMNAYIPPPTAPKALSIAPRTPIDVIYHEPRKGVKWP